MATPQSHVLSEPQRRKHMLVRFYAVAVLGGFVGLIAWCGLDYLYVRVPGWQTNEYDGLLLIFPLLITVTGIVLQAGRSPSERIGLGCLAAFIASFIAVVLIAFIGMQFHFAIGGKS